MVCLLKQKTDSSPGIIVFSSDEWIFGVISRSKKIRTILEESNKNKEWIYGVHLQGNYSFLKQWPLTPWLDFVMCMNQLYEKD